VILVLLEQKELEGKRENKVIQDILVLEESQVKVHLV
jgi:hypothetical protein